MGILPSHVPTLGVLSAGWATVYKADGSTNKYFVSSGSYAVNDDGSVMISAEKELAAAQARTGAGDDKAKAEAQIEVETLEAILK